MAEERVDFLCSVCNNNRVQTRFVVGQRIPDRQWFYCYNCGKKMLFKKVDVDVTPRKKQRIQR